ncbi:MAG TPA: hypothetical protein PLD62_06740 [Candidatus Cloacimonadota bacterium]|nr:hypothetical protein [Candidatus Cloacimonadota bacterium]
MRLYLYHSLSIYNIKGQKVKTLECNNSFAANVRVISLREVIIVWLGSNSFAATSGSCRTYSETVLWNGDDETGKLVTSGIYFDKLKVGNQESVKRMLLLK